MGKEVNKKWAGYQLTAELKWGQRKEKPGVMGGRAAGERNREMSKEHDGKPEDREFQQL